MRKGDEDWVEKLWSIEEKECECYEEEVQPNRKTDYKPIIYY